MENESDVEETLHNMLYINVKQEIDHDDLGDSLRNNTERVDVNMDIKKDIPLLHTEIDLNSDETLKNTTEKIKIKKDEVFKTENESDVEETIHDILHINIKQEINDDDFDNSSTDNREYVDVNKDIKKDISLLHTEIDLNSVETLKNKQKVNIKNNQVLKTVEETNISQQEIDDDDSLTSNLTASQRNAARCKEYRERKKRELANATSTAKTAAQRGKEYRERQKLSAKQPKTNAQRQKEYRQRKKNIEKYGIANPPNPDCQQSVKKKSHAERQKEYEQRLKNMPSESQGSHFDNLLSEKNSRKCRRYRARLNGKTFEDDDDLSTNNLAASQRNAARCKEYRERKKKEQTKTSAAKSDAQRYKEYRNRQKLRELQKFTSSEVPRKKFRNDFNSTQDSLIEASEILRNNDDDNNMDQSDVMSTVESSIVNAPVIYSCYNQHASAHLEFLKIFKNNTFGHSCAVCDRLWWKNDLKPSSPGHVTILNNILPNIVDLPVDICKACKAALDNDKIPALATFNGFSYPKIPSHLPALDLVSQRLILPRIPFMQICRLRHIQGQCGVYGQIINIPIDVNTTVTKLPRSIDNIHSFYVHINKKIIQKSSSIHRLADKQKIKEWLEYLVETPLYIHHNITIDDTFFDGDDGICDLNIDDISEDITIKDILQAQQQTLLWNENDIFIKTPGQNKVPISLLFDEYAEELSFPTIYGGQFREYKENIRVTPFMQVISELRRTDRRGVDPQHLLYLAAKIMRLRVKIAFKKSGTNTNITKEQIQDINYLSDCVETNLACLRCIPNSTWYWSDRKKDLFAMMRQRGAPTAFMTLSCNEIGWTELLKLLHKLKYNTEISDEDLSKMSFIQKTTLINEDAVTCAIYFNKLVDSFMHILQAKKKSPFGKYRVLDYFQRIEFQHQSSPYAHIFMWLNNAPSNLLTNNADVINMIDELVSVSASEASGNIKLQTHKHTPNCYKKIDPNEKQKCRFEAPFMPSKTTVILLPMNNTDQGYSEDFQKYKKQFKVIQKNLEKFDYTDFEQFYNHNNIDSDQHYQNILRAGINRPKLFYRRAPSEKWHNPFNPFVLHHLKSNMDFQIILDEYTSAVYVDEYVNKSHRGFSNLRHKITEIIEENPEFDLTQITKKMSDDLISKVEMSAQEAAWYLLRMPMAKSKIETVYIPTIWPVERQRIRKTMKKLEEMDGDCTDISMENWFDKYEKRPEELEDINLAQFVSKYYKNNKGEYDKRKEPKIIRYRNYDMTTNFEDYRREMVLLYIPFRNEENDVLAENKFIELYEANKNLILERRKEFESNFDIQKTLRIIEQLEKHDEEEIDILDNEINFKYESDPLL